MIIVTGEARSGTSLQMQLCRALGFSIAGKRNNHIYGEDEFKVGVRIGNKVVSKKFASPEQIEKSIDMNPEGYWEMSRVVKNGLSKDMAAGKVPSLVSEPITEDVIKILSHGLQATHGDLIDKIIFCIRDPREVVTSQRDIIYSTSNDSMRYMAYIEHTKSILSYIEDEDWDIIKVVDFKDMHEKTEETIKGIASFLGKDVNSEALAVVRPDLYRSKPLAYYNKEADELYRQLRGRI